ncbi:ethanolamine utilization protein, EutP [Enterococcus canis]|uniref:Ethanolamine utilization protein, EutP n=1 Tax=Enterococcus canis TaxID=214095 RepID=A0A1L8RHX1_9ENTE|nr:EutP/PduV family microcompartment system protein [Enterococcus canis]OJG19381.1 ethanolamine utilization protein, EutP [Enterococcus canis]
MKKIILMGAVGCGKTTLCQAIQGEELRYQKTQAVTFLPELIDTPGEFILHRQYYNALNVTAADARVIGLVQSVTEQSQIFSPGFGTIFPKKIVGIVTKIDQAEEGQLAWVRNQLVQAGASEIFEVSAFTGAGVPELAKFIHELEE